MSDIISKEDAKYFVHKPDPSFSPKRNQAIIQETIQETEKFFNTIGKVIDDNLGNRMDIFSTYAVNRLNGNTQKSFKDYAGKRLFTELVGEKILEKLRVMESVNRLNGNTKYKNFIQL